MDYAAVAATLNRLAAEAGRIVMQVYEGPEFEVALKADDSPVTIADERADAHIRAGLRDAFPDIPVVTEELTESHALSAERFFIVDPLDGTKEFVKRRGEFTVNIALVENGAPTRGVVYAPALDRMFYVDAQGRAVEARPAQGLAREISVAAPDNAALRVVASKSHRDAATDEYIARYAVKDFVSAGSSLKFCLVAAGEADLYPRLGRTMEWDTAAGHAVAAAAGARVDRLDESGPLAYGKPGYENPFFICYAPGVEVKPL